MKKEEVKVLGLLGMIEDAFDDEAIDMEEVFEPSNFDLIATKDESETLTYKLPEIWKMNLFQQPT